jgi:hypothetical protein
MIINPGQQPQVQGGVIPTVPLQSLESQFGQNEPPGPGASTAPPPQPTPPPQARPPAPPPQARPLALPPQGSGGPPNQPSQQQAAVSTGPTPPATGAPTPLVQNPPPYDPKAVKASFDQAVAGGVDFARQMAPQDSNHPHSARDTIALHSGVGAMPADHAQNVYQHWSDGGRLDPGTALTRYMVARYEALSAIGETAQANQMAFEVLQRLNREAAAHGGVALNYLKAGNIPAAAAAVQTGHSFMPDGLALGLSRDGKTGVMIDTTTGKPTTANFQITPIWILQQATGMADGTQFWNHLAMRAQTFAGGKGQVKDPEMRALALANSQMLYELRKRKLLGGGGKGGGGGGGGGGTAMADYMARFGKAGTGGGSGVQPQPQGGGESDGLELSDAGTSYDDGSS